MPVPTTTTGTSLSGSSHQPDPPSISPPSRQAPTAQLSYSRHDPVRSVSPLASAALQPPVLTAAESPSSTSMLDHVVVEYLTEAYYHFAYALCASCPIPANRDTSLLMRQNAIVSLADLQQYDTRRQIQD